MKLKLFYAIAILCLPLMGQSKPVDCAEKGSLLVLYKMKSMIYMRMALKSIPRSSALPCHSLKKEEYSALNIARSAGVKNCLEGHDEIAFGGSVKSSTPLMEAIKNLHKASGDSNCFGNFMAKEFGKVARRVKNIKNIDAICIILSPLNTKIYNQQVRCENNVRQA